MIDGNGIGPVLWLLVVSARDGKVQRRADIELSGSGVQPIGGGVFRPAVGKSRRRQRDVVGAGLQRHLVDDLLNPPLGAWRRIIDKEQVRARRADLLDRGLEQGGE